MKEFKNECGNAYDLLSRVTRGFTPRAADVGALNTLEFGDMFTCPNGYLYVVGEKSGDEGVYARRITSGIRDRFNRHMMPTTGHLRLRTYRARMFAQRVIVAHFNTQR